MSNHDLKRLNRHVLRQALDGTPTPALIVETLTSACQIVYANPSVEAVAGLTPSEIVGRPFAALAAEAPEIGGTDPWRLRSRSGQTIDLTPTPLYDQPGRAHYWLLTAATGSGVQRTDAQATPGATTGTFTATDTWFRTVRDDRTDAVTGVPSRASFLEVLQRDFASARREQRSLAVAVFRIDGFDSYQLLFGRHAADSSLRKVAHAISNSLRRNSDYCGRVGADRFAVLFAATDATRVAEFADRITQRVRDLAIHHPRSPSARYLTVSNGCSAEIPPKTAEECCLLEEAEARLDRQELRDGRAAG